MFNNLKLQKGLAPITIILIVVGIMAIVGGGFYAWQKSTKPSITLLSPNGGEIWAIGSTYTIRWTSQNIPQTDKISIHIRRVPPPPLPETGQEFDPIIFIELENTGSVNWTISDMYPVGNYIIEVNSYSSIPITKVISDESDAPFRIESSSDEIADWKVYKNEKYGFEMKFPESWADFEVKEYKWDQSTDPGLLPPYYDVIDFLRTRIPEYDFSIQIQAYSHDQWAVRRLKQQIEISAALPDYPYLGENKDYVFSWRPMEYISHPGMSQEEYTRAKDIIQLRKMEAESIISTFKLINPLKKTAEWKNYFNPGECQDIEENDYTNECYLESIKTLTEAIMCKRIRPDYKDFCHFQIAQNLKDFSICRNLSALINQESCYQNVARVLKDASICGNIPTERWRNTCYGDVAELLKDPSICEEIANPKAKGYCLMGANPKQPELPIPPISEWKTYTNEKHKYSFKHPPKWDFSVSFTNPDTSKLHVIREQITNQTATHEWLWFVTIDVWDNPSELSLIDWLKSRREPGGLIPKDMPFAANTFVGEEKIEALQVWQDGTSTWDKPGKCFQACPSLAVYFVYKDKAYLVGLEYRGEVDDVGQESQETFSQILSTFKFIEEDKTVQISVFVDMESFDLVNKTFEGWWVPKIGEKTKVKVITTDSTEFYRTSEPEWEKEYFTFSELYSKTVRTWPLTVKGIFEKEGVIKASEVFIIAQ